MALNDKDKQFIISEIDKKICDLANMIAFHMNLHTDGLTSLDKKLNGIIPKGVIGYQVRKDNWPENSWSSVMLFQNNDISFPTWGPDWKFRYVYANIDG